MKVLFGIVLLFGFFAAVLTYFSSYRDKVLATKGNGLVEKIEDFRAKEGRLPASLGELGIQSEELFYLKWDSMHYIVWYGTSLGESITYYSDSRRWENKQRGF